ncbi:MAG: energy transducer TonB [Pseudomonadota bacterium]
MRYLFVIVCFVTLGLGLGPYTAHSKILTLEPSSDWRLREYDDRCRASRTFGEGKDQTSLWIEQGGEEPFFNLTLIGRPLRHPYGGGVYVQFGDQPEFVRSYISAKSSKGRPVLRMYGVGITQPEIERDDPDAPRKADLSRARASLELATAASITTLKLRSSIVEPLTLEMGSFEEPLEFLHTCGAKIGLLLSEAARPLTKEASPPKAIDEGRWLTAEDYPSYLVRAKMQGQIGVRLTVSKTGKPTSCFVVESDKPQLFDDAVCLGLMKKARFEPAFNGMREPIASYYFTRIVFTIE